jgi:hypothetical protein
MEWNVREEELLRNVERQCNDLHRYYTKEYESYSRISKRFNIPILVVSAINALTAIALNDYLNQKYVSILNAVLSSATGVIGSIQLYLKLNERMANALSSSIRFRDLALSISKELSIDTKDRLTDGKTFVNKVYDEFLTVLKQGNPITKKFNNYLKLDKDQTDIQSIASTLLSMRGNETPETSTQGEEMT